MGVEDQDRRLGVLLHALITFSRHLPDLLGAVESRPGLRPACVEGQMGNFGCYLVLGDAVLFPMFR